MSIQDVTAPIERAIATLLVDRALAKGWLVSVNNGGDENEIEPTNDRAVILEAMAAADDETLLFFNPAEKRRVGWVLLVYGNDDALVSDYSYNDATDDLVEGVEHEAAAMLAMAVEIHRAMVLLLNDADAAHADPKAHGMEVTNPEHPWHASITDARRVWGEMHALAGRLRKA